ncbi:MAG: MCP four helix bundle domain-containing protein, partial [Reyranella sp.]|nr:MCP four helix bundle domain-containing protein [Reyranella sp.]
MTIGRKIIGGYAVVLALLALMTIVAFYSLNRVQATYEGLIDVNKRLVDGANELRFELRDQIAHYRAILLYPDIQEKYREDLQADHRQFKDAVEKMRHAVLTGEGRTMLDEIAALQAKNEQAQAQVIDLVGKGKRVEALASGIKEVRPLTTTLIEKVGGFRDRQLQLVAAERAELAKMIDLLTLVMGVTAVLGLGAGLGIAFYLSRAITRQLRESVTQLSSSSAEILATTTLVASCAAETATAVSETTATVEEVKQTA